ncbi:cytochrome P450 [Streptomyces rhizosphaericus]|uniref:cytochrome P450 n=1 Tax=Streptomyces rhizosphaericus TaxID=114699 RepID=UPI00202EF757|nr:cytochrome P450 [Streptomyces rhizosphaericus]
MTTRHLTDPAQDPVPVGTPEFKAHAHERYAQLRSLAPIHRVRLADSSVSWLVVGYDLAREALAHPKLSKNPEPYAEALRASGREILLAGTGFGGNMLMADPPEHTRLRRLVADAFMSGATARLAPRIEELAHELIDAIADRGEADLVASYTGPLPMAVICELLGVPAQRQADLQAWTRTAMGNPSAPQRSGLLALNAYLRDLLEVKRQSPANDLLSRLIAVRDQDGGRLHPDQACALRARPELIPEAVEEFLRFDASVETTPGRAGRRPRSAGRGASVAPAPVLRSWDPPLHRCSSRPAGGGHSASGPVHPVARSALGRPGPRGGVAARRHHARTRAAPGPLHSGRALTGVSDLPECHHSPASSPPSARSSRRMPRAMIVTHNPPTMVPTPRPISPRHRGSRPGG